MGVRNSYPLTSVNMTPRMPTVTRTAQTVVNFQPLMSAITSLPGWNRSVGHAHHPVRSLPTVLRHELLSGEGKVLWPVDLSADARITPILRTVETDVAIVERERRTYGVASIRHVVDARNALSELAREALPSLKARDSVGASELERFIVELQKTLATMAAHY